MTPEAKIVPQAMTIKAITFFSWVLLGSRAFSCSSHRRSKADRWAESFDSSFSVSGLTALSETVPTESTSVALGRR